VSVYYDVLNHISIDSSINHTKASERACAAMHLQYAQPNDLSILDRGYNAFWLYALYEAKNQPFCMRAKINRGKQFKAFADSGEAQTVITLTPNKKSVGQCKEKGLPRSGCGWNGTKISIDISVILHPKEFTAIYIDVPSDIAPESEKNIRSTDVVIQLNTGETIAASMSRSNQWGQSN